jgi:hypothetical protein
MYTFDNSLPPQLSASAEVILQRRYRCCKLQWINVKELPDQGDIGSPSQKTTPYPTGVGLGL